MCHSAARGAEIKGAASLYFPDTDVRVRATRSGILSTTNRTAPSTILSWELEIAREKKKFITKGFTP